MTPNKLCGKRPRDDWKICEIAALSIIVCKNIFGE
jgi:hypothetical protein